MGLTAEDCGIVNNSRLTVTFIVDEMKTEPEIMVVSIAIMQHDPHIGLTADAIFAKATFNASGHLENWNLGCLGLQFLPEILGNVKASGSMDLNDNRIVSLPESIGTMEIGGDL